MIIFNDYVPYVFTAATEIAEKLGADMSGVTIQYDPSLDIDKKEYSCTTFSDSGTLVSLNPRLAVLSIPEVLAHELAHCITGIGEAHGPVFEKVFDDIYDLTVETYNEVMDIIESSSKVEQKVTLN